MPEPPPTAGDSAVLNTLSSTANGYGRLINPSNSCSMTYSEIQSRNSCPYLLKINIIFSVAKYLH